MQTFKEYLAEKRKKEKDPCWDNYKQLGTKEKDGKQVPNCIPENFEIGDTLIMEDDSEWEIVSEAEYQGREVELNKPMSGDIKKSKVYVKNSKGNVVKVEFGDKSMSIKKHIPANKKSYCARSAGQGNTTDKTSANYWSRKAWDC